MWYVLPSPAVPVSTTLVGLSLVSSTSDFVYERSRDLNLLDTVYPQPLPERARRTAHPMLHSGPYERRKSIRGLRCIRPVPSQVANRATGGIRIVLQNASRHLCDIVEASPVYPCVLAGTALLLVASSPFSKRFGMALLKSLPFGHLLIEAKVAS